jgi:hypothetical protein
VKKDKPASIQTDAEVAVARLTAFLPGHYAAVRNVLLEMQRRQGPGWLQRAAEANDKGKAKSVEETKPATPAESSEEQISGTGRTSSEGLSEGQGESSQAAATSAVPGVIEITASMGPGLW